jgi:glucokinase
MKSTGKAIGIDIGGTKIAIGAVDGDARIRHRLTLETKPEAGFDNAVARISRAIEELLAAAAWVPAELSGIGIGCTGPVSPFRGTIHNPYTLPGWDNCNIVTSLSQRLGVPVRLENDADAALLGECFAGAGRGFDPVVMLTFGTGIGGATLANGHLLRGVAGEHPELGHIPVKPDGPPCYCGRPGCLEALASGTAIEAAGRGAGFPGSREVFAAAAKGDSRAKSLVDDALHATATATWTILHAFLPQRILLGGGIMDDHYAMFAEVVRSGIEAATMAPRGQISVAKAALGNDAGLVGAASLAFAQPNNLHSTTTI